MTAKVFFDTNVMVYAAIGTGKDEHKGQRALELIESEDFGTGARMDRAMDGFSLNDGQQYGRVRVVNPFSRPVT